jgi:hypothetical protein
MKRYTVVYLAEAADELATLWQDGTDRGDIAAAADLADIVLATTPRAEAVFLGEDLWRLDFQPLRFYLTIRDDDCLVEVSNVLRVT